MCDAILYGRGAATSSGISRAAYCSVQRRRQYRARAKQWEWCCRERLAPRLIVDALERGDFYASTGVELSDYQATDKGITITVKEAASSKYRIQFIGRNGRVLKEALSSPATYTFTVQAANGSGPGPVWASAR